MKENKLVDFALISLQNHGIIYYTNLNLSNSIFTHLLVALSHRKADTFMVSAFLFRPRDSNPSLCLRRN